MNALIVRRIEEEGSFPSTALIRNTRQKQIPQISTVVGCFFSFSIHSESAVCILDFSFMSNSDQFNYSIICYQN